MECLSGDENTDSCRRACLTLPAIGVAGKRWFPRVDITSCKPVVAGMALCERIPSGSATLKRVDVFRMGTGLTHASELQGADLAKLDR